MRNFEEIYEELSKEMKISNKYREIEKLRKNLIDLKRYKEQFRKEIMPVLVEKMGENLKYYPKGKVSEWVYRNSRLAGNFSKISSEDLIMGTIDSKYSISLAEVTAQYQNTEGLNTHKTNLFCNIECAKNIDAELEISKGIIAKLDTKIEKINKNISFKIKEELTMDSSIFNKYFDIYSDNKIVAMQILTADVMEILLDTTYKKLNYVLRISDNQIYIKFYTGQVFEPSGLKSSLNYNLLKESYDIINFAVRLTRAINRAIENTEV